MEESITPAAALRMISDAKNKMYGPEAFEEMAFTTEEEIVARTYRLYEQQKKAGRDPVFAPEKFGIDDYTGAWDKYKNQ